MRKLQYALAAGLLVFGLAGQGHVANLGNAVNLGFAVGLVFAIGLAFARGLSVQTSNLDPVGLPGAGTAAINGSGA